MEEKNKIKKGIRELILNWNNNYPFDFIWRKKYGVAFGSPEHRQMSFLDMIYDLEEEKFMSNLMKKKELEIKEEETKISTISDEEFDDIDLEQFNN